MKDLAINPITNLIKIHKEVDIQDFERIWKEGIFIFDSNVLLDLYRLPESASKDLLKVLKSKEFTNRIWIGFQVLVEFLNNRHEAISDQKNKFGVVRKHLTECSSQYFEILSALSGELSQLKLKQRHSLIDPDKFITASNIESGIKFVRDFIDHLDSLEKKQSDVNDRDSLQDLVLELFDGKIGEGFSKAELEKFYELGEKRYQNSIPPGYKDKGKTGSYLIDDREFIRKFGDLILWHEIIKKAKSENLKYVVLITGDVKEDWWYEKRGKKLGPRRELLNEIYHQAPSLEVFHMYDTSNFLMRARDAFNIKVQESSIKEAKILVEASRQSRDRVSDSFYSLQDLIYSVSEKLAGLHLELTSAFMKVPLLNVQEKVLHQSISDIFSYMLLQYLAEKVTIGARVSNDNIVVRLQCRKTNPQRNDNSELDMLASDDASDERYATLLNSIRVGLGLQDIKTTLPTMNQRKFIIELFIPASRFLNPPLTLKDESDAVI